VHNNNNIMSMWDEGREGRGRKGGKGKEGRDGEGREGRGGKREGRGKMYRNNAEGGKGMWGKAP
jgi:hypothetical protein